MSLGGALRSGAVARHRGRGPARSPAAAARTEGSGERRGRAAPPRAGGRPARRGPLLFAVWAAGSRPRSPRRCGGAGAALSGCAGASPGSDPAAARLRSRPCGSRPPAAPLRRLRCHRRPPGAGRGGCAGSVRRLSGPLRRDPCRRGWPRAGRGRPPGLFPAG